MARRREAGIRPLAAQPSLDPAVVTEAAQHLEVSRSLLYHLLRLYRKGPQTSTLLLRRKGRPLGAHQLDEEAVEASSTTPFATSFSPKNVRARRT